MDDLIYDKDNTTHEQFGDMMEEWINANMLVKYMDSKYDKWLLFIHGNWNELFIADDEIDTYNEHLKGYEDLYYIVDEVCQVNEIEFINDDESLSWVTDRVSEGTLTIGAFSEMVNLKDLKVEFDNDDNILYIDGDEETLKEIYKLNNKEYK